MNCLGAIDEIRNENSQMEKTSNKKQIEGTTLAILMENSAQAFRSEENQMRRRQFTDITNCQNNRYQKRNISKNDPFQTSITDYAIVKHKLSTVEHLRKTVNEESEENLKRIGLIANTSHSSPSRSTSETDIDDEMIHDSSSCSIQNDSDKEMYDLQKHFSRVLGKRLSVSQQDIRENVQQPLIKRRKEVIFSNLQI
ncbi:unnamed protein product [Cercopithifilaria johnstoni]|uniref:Uncharacterized protein n=1 Tax=Cercopithifilaria johnstoni TaxID=2874296 RepID=A0A8J2Q3R1_9BILA|nr:unnamed protein product [Cercopithifilaria johnstoni]